MGLLRLKISLSIRNRTESILKSMESLLIFYPILSLSLDRDKDFSHNEVVIPCVDNNQETKDDFANIAEHGIYDIC